KSQKAISIPTQPSDKQTAPPIMLATKARGPNNGPPTSAKGIPRSPPHTAPDSAPPISISDKCARLRVSLRINWMVVDDGPARDARGLAGAERAPLAGHDTWAVIAPSLACWLDMSSYPVQRLGITPIQHINTPWQTPRAPRRAARSARICPLPWAG